MKNSLLLLATLFLLLTACNSSNKSSDDNKTAADSLSQVDTTIDSQQLSEVITRFVRAYISKDNQKVNKLIHPELGLYIISRPGAMDTYQRVDSLDFEHPIPEYFPYNGITNNFALTFDTLPVFDCGTDEWNKLGLIVDTSTVASQLTNIASFKHEFKEIDDQELSRIKQLEQGTLRVILTSEIGRAHV